MIRKLGDVKKKRWMKNNASYSTGFFIGFLMKKLTPLKTELGRTNLWQLKENNIKKVVKNQVKKIIASSKSYDD